MKSNILFILLLLLFFIPSVSGFESVEWGVYLKDVDGNPDISSSLTGAFENPAVTIANRADGDDIQPLFLEYDTGEYGIWTNDGMDMQLLIYNESAVGFMTLVDEFTADSTDIIGYTALPTVWNTDNNTDATNTIVVVSGGFCGESGTTTRFQRIFYNTTSKAIERMGGAGGILAHAGGGTACHAPACDHFLGSRGGTWCYVGTQSFIIEYEPSTNTAITDTIAGTGSPTTQNGDCHDGVAFADAPRIPPALGDMDGDGVTNIAMCGSNGAEAIIFMFEQDQFNGAAAGLGDVPLAGDTQIHGVSIVDLDGGNLEIVLTDRLDGVALEVIRAYVYDETLTKQATLTLYAGEVGYTSRVSNPVVADFTDTGDATICALWTKDETAGTDDELNLYCREWNAADTETATIASGADADNMFFTETRPLFAYTLDEVTSNFVANSVTYDLTDDIMLSSASGYVRTLVSLTDDTNSWDDKVLLYQDGDNSTHMDKFSIMIDANDDDIADVFAVEDATMNIFLPTFRNVLPNLTAQYGVNLVGDVCINSFRTWNARRCNPVSIASGRGTDELRCNYINELDSDEIRLYSTCGNGTAQINGTYVQTTVSQGIYGTQTTTVELSCYFDSVGPRAFEVCIEDRANQDTQDFNSCIPVNVNIVNSTVSGIDCNFPCQDGQCWPGLISDHVDDGTGIDVSEQFTANSMAQTVNMITGGNIWVKNVISMSVIISTIIFLASSGSHPFILYILTVSITSIAMSMLTFLAWSVSFVIVALSMIYLILTGMFDVGGTNGGN